MIRLLFILLATSITFSLSAQDEKLVVEGAIVIQDSDDPNPVAGTIRWTGSDFEGFDGTNWISLTCCASGLQPKDCNGYIYQYVQIGDQFWLSENLRATCFNDGTPIPWANSVSEWNPISSTSGTTPAGAFAGYDVNNSEGALYNWNTAAPMNNNLNVCPVGWHVPTFADFEILRDEIDPNANGNFNNAGGPLKTINTIGTGGNWLAPNTGATDIFQFSANPQYNHNTGNSSENRVHFWSQGTLNGFGEGIQLRYDDEAVRQSGLTKSSGAPIRCVKD